MPLDGGKTCEDLLEDKKALDQGFLLTVVANSPCRSACLPAPARHDKIHVLDDDSGEGGADADAGPPRSLHVGLPDFASLGYAELDEKPQDKRLSSVLGVRLLMHRKTGASRLCLRKEKARIAREITAEHIKALARKLKHLEHVNVLRCFEVAEDDQYLHFVFEHMQGQTLATAVKVGLQPTWSEKQVANLAREVTGAVYAAELAGLRHLDLGPDMVLVHEDARVAKVFGFGIGGILVASPRDRLHWSPEARHAHDMAEQLGKKFCLGWAEPKEHANWDAWGLGFVLYNLAEGHPPYSGGDALQSELAFPFNFACPQARSTIEALLTLSIEDRASISKALQSEWLRMHRCATSAHMAEALRELDAFCCSPLANRLFGRFLVQFLDDRQLRHIARTYDYLDVDGDGVVSEADLQVIAKMSGAGHQTVRRIVAALADPGASCISFWRFADSLTESTIDGRTLRLAFESIDEDGSEEITPGELWETLSALGPGLTVAQVVEHIESVEAAAAGGPASPQSEQAADANQDQALDFEEFCCLFRRRVERVKALEARNERARHLAMEMGSKFEGIRDLAEEFVNALNTVQDDLHNAKGLAVERFRGEQAQVNAVSALRETLKKADASLKGTPGPHDDLEVLTMERKHGKRHVVVEPGHHHHHHRHGKKEDLVFGFDDFLQERGAEQDWYKLLAREVREVTQTKAKTEKHHKLHESDYLSVYKHVNRAGVKLKEVEEWSRGQAKEYEAFVETFRVEEESMPRLPLSCRGLHRHHDRPGSPRGPRPTGGGGPLLLGSVATHGGGGGWDSDLNPFRCLCAGGGLQLSAAAAAVRPLD